MLNFFHSSKFDFWLFLKLQKMEFGQNKISWNWFIWFHEFFWPGLFYIFWSAVCFLASYSSKSSQYQIENSSYLNLHCPIPMYVVYIENKMANFFSSKKVNCTNNKCIKYCICLLDDYIPINIKSHFQQYFFLRCNPCHGCHAFLKLFLSYCEMISRRRT